YRERQTIFVKVDHRQPGDCECFIGIEGKRSAKLFNRQAKLSGAENRGPEERVSARREWIEHEHPCGVVVGALKISQLVQGETQTEPRVVIVCVFADEVAKDLLRLFVVA